ncbi:F-actin-capping protein subunit alpha [Irpex lacteus]|nr:F-actin-capping protein subunit alpha [Irpex lacteus]
MSAEDRIQAASKFLLQSPPGEINDVLNDVRNIISDDDTLQAGIQPALQEYNLAQFITASVPGRQHQSIVSEAARVPPGAEDEEADGEDRFWDPRSRTSFKFDHLTLEAKEPQHYEPETESEPFRTALETSALSYISAHFHDGVVSVFPTHGNVNKYVIQVVANKYNPSNFWSGRWRSEYIVDLEARTLAGKILVNVHYYEQGNVQLSTNHTISLDLPSGITSSPEVSSASKILAIISDEETKYQTTLNESYQDLGDNTFKTLRRALPITRAKLDWDKVLGYKLGQELSGSKGGFGGSS